jgi:hypothetical protein
VIYGRTVTTIRVDMRKTLITGQFPFVLRLQPPARSGIDTHAGHWAYEQRLRASVESEAAAKAQERDSKRKARTRLAVPSRNDTGAPAAAAPLHGGSTMQVMIYLLALTSFIAFEWCMKNLFKS